MNWKELQNNIIDLGFEEDTTYTEYKRIVINSCNRALQVINITIIPQIKDYLTGKWGYSVLSDDGLTSTWVFPTITKITTDTADDANINIPDELAPLVPLLAAHYVWLDDDLTKSEMYWNEYDDLRQQILGSLKIPYKCVIEGGF